jgi:hypothetical protein
MSESERAFFADDLRLFDHLANVTEAMLRRDLLKYREKPKAWIERMRAREFEIRKAQRADLVGQQV